MKLWYSAKIPFIVNLDVRDCKTLFKSVSWEIPWQCSGQASAPPCWGLDCSLGSEVPQTVWCSQKGKQWSEQVVNSLKWQELLKVTFMHFSPKFNRAIPQWRVCMLCTGPEHKIGSSTSAVFLTSPGYQESSGAASSLFWAISATVAFGLPFGHSFRNSSSLHKPAWVGRLGS